MKKYRKVLSFVLVLATVLGCMVFPAYEEAYADSTTKIIDISGISGSNVKNVQLVIPLNMDLNNITYTGEEIHPGTSGAVQLKWKKEIGSEQYSVNAYSCTISYGSNNTNVGTGTMKISASFSAPASGGWNGTKTCEETIEFAIKGKDISKNITISGISNYPYSGSAISPEIVIYDNDRSTQLTDADYTLAYSNNTDAGTAKVTITGKGNYSGERTVNFNILPIAISNVTIDGISEQEYKGKQVTLSSITVTATDPTSLHEGDHYTVVYGDNNMVGSGKGSVTVRPANNYAFAEVEKKFDITRGAVTAQFGSSIEDQRYTGYKIQPSLNVITSDGYPLVQNQDYKVEYGANVGMATGDTGGNKSGIVTVSALENGRVTFTNSISTTFAIKESNDIIIKSITLSASEYEYDGTAKEPKVTIKYTKHGGAEQTLEEGNYSISYISNINAGTATAIIDPAGDASFPRRTLDFTIKPKQINSLNVKFDKTSYEYTGSEIVPSIKLFDGTTEIPSKNYVIDCSNNTKAGTASYTVRVATGANYTFTPKNDTFTITRRNIKPEIATIEDQTYTGEKITPEVYFTNISLSEFIKGTDYTLEYSSNTSVGTATVYVKPTDNSNVIFSTISQTFNIIPAAAALDTSKITLTVGGVHVNVGSTHAVTYSGVAVGASVSYAVDPEIKTSDLELSYYIAGDTNTPVTMLNAGTYDICVSVKNSGNHRGTAPVKIASLVINKATIDASMYTCTIPSNTTYDALSHAAVVGVNDGYLETIQYNNSNNIPEILYQRTYTDSGVSKTVTIASAPTDYGQYYVFIKALGGPNYEGKIVTLGSFTINKYQVEATDLVYTNSSLIYTGKAKTKDVVFTDNAIFDSAVYNKFITVQYTTSGNTKYSTSAPVAVGKYDVKVIVSPSDISNFSGGEFKLSSFEIIKNPGNQDYKKSVTFKYTSGTTIATKEYTLSNCNVALPTPTYVTTKQAFKGYQFVLTITKNSRKTTTVLSGVYTNMSESLLLSIQDAEKVEAIAKFNTVYTPNVVASGAATSISTKTTYSSFSTRSSLTLVENMWNDVKTTDYFYKPLQWCYDNDILDPISRRTFGVGKAASRADLILAFYNANGCPSYPSTQKNPFKDVNKWNPYYDAVMWSYYKGFILGTSATTFEPNAKLTRADLITVLWRFNGKGVVKGTKNFKDVPKNSYYTNGVNWATNIGLIVGTSDTTFEPQEAVLRQDEITIYYRYFVEAYK